MVIGQGKLIISTVIYISPDLTLILSTGTEKTPTNSHTHTEGDFTTMTGEYTIEAGLPQSSFAIFNFNELSSFWISPDLRYCVFVRGFWLKKGLRV